VSGKGGHDRIVYLTDVAIQALQHYLALWPDGAQALLFVSMRGRRLDRNALAHRLSALAAEAQVAHVSPHRLRHTFATRLINVGMPITDLQKLLGHDRLSTTQIYVRVYDATVERDYRLAMERLQADTRATAEEGTAMPSLLSRALEMTLDTPISKRPNRLAKSPDAVLATGGMRSSLQRPESGRNRPVRPAFRA
jgi:hypothetical protein